MLGAQGFRTLAFLHRNCLAAVLLAGVSASAMAQDQSVKNPEELARIANAIGICDRGATAPLDPAGKAPPVDLFSFTQPVHPGIAATRDACAQARAAMPDEARFQFQLARVNFADPATRQMAMADIRNFARQGQADAMFLVWAAYVRGGHNPLRESTIYQDALANLRRAAAAGHAGALAELRQHARFGYFLRVNLQEALEAARGLANAPPQGPFAETSDTELARKRGRFLVAAMLIDVLDKVDEAELARAREEINKLRGANGFEEQAATVIYAQALRKGKGGAADPAQARAILESEVAANRLVGAAMLAEMLAFGEGGAKDVPRALQLLSLPGSRIAANKARVALRIHLGNEVHGRDPLAAIAIGDDSLLDADQLIEFARLLAEHPAEGKDALRKGNLIVFLSHAAAGGDDAAGLALANLLMSRNSAYRDAATGQMVLKALADRGNIEAQMKLIAEHVPSLDSSSQPQFNALVYNEAQARALIEKGVAANATSALTLQALMMRKGVIFAQDDRTATQLLLKATQAGGVDAMLHLAKAYNDGLGVEKDNRERIRWLREAAQRGSIAAKKSLGDAFTFDWSDRLLSLREGVSEPLAVWANRAGESRLAMNSFDNMTLSRIFRGRSHNAPPGPIADAVMDGLRLAPHGLREESLVAMGRAMQPPLRMEIERKLAADGFLKQAPDGFFGPQARQALRDWVAARGPLPDVAPRADSTAKPAETQSAPFGVAFDLALANKLRAHAWRTPANEAERRASITTLAELARYGDLTSRFGLMSNYHKMPLIRQIITPAEVTRFALDVMITNPKGAEKANFDYMFNITSIFQAKQSVRLGEAFIDAVRDDKRLQDEEALSAILGHTKMSPGGCAGISSALRQRKAPAGDGECGAATRAAVLAYAKAAGPAGVEAKARKAAAAAVAKLAAGLK